MHFTISRSALALTTLLSLAACGGSGSDTAPLALISTSPANGATNIARTAQPGATFDQSLNAASVSGASVQLLSPLGLPVAADISVSNAVLSLKPKAGALPGGSTYTLQLGTGLQSAAGGALAGATSVRFSTVAQQWSTATQFHSAPTGLSIFTPVVVTDAGGIMTAVWAQQNGTRYMINASRYSNGSWSVPVQVDNPAATGDTFSPDITVDAAGNVMAVWIQDAPRYKVNASRYSNGSWSVPVQIDNPAATKDAYSPAIAVDATGNMTAIWYQSNGTRDVINASRYSKGAWSAPVQVDSFAATGNALSPAIAVDAGGNVTAVWAQSNGTRYLIQASTYKNGTWSAPAQVDSPTATGSASEPKIAMDGSGNGIAVWYQHNGTRHVVYASRYSNVSWSAPVQLDDPTTTEDAYRPKIVMDGAGNTTITWTQFSGTHLAAYANHYSNGAWSAPLQLDDPTSTGDAFANLAVDPAGNVIAAWAQDWGKAINARRYSNGAWSALVRVDNGSATVGASSPALAVDGAGNVMAVWSQTTGSIKTLNAARFE